MVTISHHCHITYYFVGTFAMLCDFHRMQAWNRFLVKIENGIPKDVAKSIKRDHLIPLSRSTTPEEFEKKKAALLASVEWKAYPKLQEYMLNNWLKDDTHKVHTILINHSNQKS